MLFNYSIIIPHKNIPELLVRCLASIPQRNDIQVIIVDDNSEDADTYLEKYPVLSRPDIEIYFTKEGKGAGFARNVGLEHIKGKWVLFADADDYFLPEWINITDQYLDIDADIIQFKIDDKSRSDCLWHNELFAHYREGEKAARETLFSSIPCCAKMLNSQFLLKNNIRFEEVKCGNDVFFGFQLAVNSNSVIISQSAIYFVSYREGSITTFKDRENSWIRYKTGKKSYAYASNNGFHRFELPYAIEVLRTWRQLGLKDYLYFICHERHEIVRASKIRIKDKPFNYRHPYLYVFLVLLKLV